MRSTCHTSGKAASCRRWLGSGDESTERVVDAVITSHRAAVVRLARRLEIHVGERRVEPTDLTELALPRQRHDRREQCVFRHLRWAASLDDTRVPRSCHMPACTVVAWLATLTMPSFSA